MRKIIILLSIMLVAIPTFAQIKPIDSLYIWVTFSNEKIQLNIPESYLNQKTIKRLLPVNVKVMEMNMAVPSLPALSGLSRILENSVANISGLDSKEKQLKYLGSVVIFLYFQTHIKNEIPEEGKTLITKLSISSDVTNEAKAVLKWLVSPSSK